VGADNDEELAKYCPKCRADLLRSKCPGCAKVEIKGHWVKAEDAETAEKLIAQGVTEKELQEAGLLERCDG
jgi:hypothetical protein